PTEIYTLALHDALPISASSSSIIRLFCALAACGRFSVIVAIGPSTEYRTGAASASGEVVTRKDGSGGADPAVSPPRAHRDVAYSATSTCRNGGTCRLGPYPRSPRPRAQSAAWLPAASS